VLKNDSVNDDDPKKAECREKSRHHPTDDERQAGAQTRPHFAAGETDGTEKGYDP